MSEARPVIGYNDTAKILFPSIYATNRHGCLQPAVSAVLNGSQATHRGLRWRYAQAHDMCGQFLHDRVRPAEAGLPYPAIRWAYEGWLPLHVTIDPDEPVDIHLSKALADAGYKTDDRGQWLAELHREVVESPALEVPKPAPKLPKPDVEPIVLAWLTETLVPAHDCLLFRDVFEAFPGSVPRKNFSQAARKLLTLAPRAANALYVEGMTWRTAPDGQFSLDQLRHATGHLRPGNDTAPLACVRAALRARECDMIRIRHALKGLGYDSYGKYVLGHTWVD